MKDVNEKLVVMVIGVICMILVFIISGYINVSVDAPDQAVPKQYKENIPIWDKEGIKLTENTTQTEQNNETSSARAPEPPEEPETDNQEEDIAKQENVTEAHQSPESVSEIEENKEDVITETTPTFTVLDEMFERGNIGRLTIPSFGVDVALFETSLYNYNHSQSIVDAADSAAYISDTMDEYGFTIIGDHVYQGFHAIKQSVPGTVLQIDRGTHVENYVCTEIFLGYNGYGNQGGMFDGEGNSVKGKNDGGICLYTCNPDGTITITFWQPVF